MIVGLPSPAQRLRASPSGTSCAASGLPDRRTNSRTRSYGLRFVGRLAVDGLVGSTLSSRTACGVDSSGMFAQPATQHDQQNTAGPTAAASSDLLPHRAGGSARGHRVLVVDRPVGTVTRMASARRRGSTSADLGGLGVRRRQRQRVAPGTRRPGGAAASAGSTRPCPARPTRPARRRAAGRPRG